MQVIKLTQNRLLNHTPTAQAGAAASLIQVQIIEMGLRNLSGSAMMVDRIFWGKFKHYVLSFPC